MTHLHAAQVYHQKSCNTKIFWWVTTPIQLYSFRRILRFTIFNIWGQGRYFGDENVSRTFLSSSSCESMSTTVMIQTCIVQHNYIYRKSSFSQGRTLLRVDRWYWQNSPKMVLITKDSNTALAEIMVNRSLIGPAWCLVTSHKHQCHDQTQHHLHIQEIFSWSNTTSPLLNNW